MSKTRIVVADASQARILSAEKPAGPLFEIQTLTNEEGKLHERDLVSDKPGRARGMGTASHDFGNETGAKEEDISRFAARVCEILEAERIKGELRKLYVIADPRFLGNLRKSRSSSMEKLVVAELSKNLVAHSLEDIRSHLPEYL